MYDLLVRGGTVVDGSGAPARTADVGVRDGRIEAVGRLSGESARRRIDADGLVVAPGIVDVHTHYDPQLTWDSLCDTSSLHGVTTVAAGNCGFSIAPCRPGDRGYAAQLFARVEGMELEALERIPWDFERFDEYLATRRGRLGVNLGMYVGHSAVRRWVMGDEAHERAATDAELEAIAQLVDDALAAGALGFSSSHAPTHLDLADRPVPSRLASEAELLRLADVVGGRGLGSIAYAPKSAVEGIDAHDRELLIELGRRGRVPVVTQGLGGRSKVDAPEETWAETRRFLDRSAEAGAPVYSLLMTRPLNGPFTLREGTSRYEGVPLWHALLERPIDERRALLRDPDHRARLRDAIDRPNRDPAAGSTLPPPFWDSLRVERTEAPDNARHRGRTVGEIAAAEARHPADVMFDIALADDLDTVFHWSNETPAWRAMLGEIQRHPQMIVGVSDGGAHLDRDDGAEWSTHFLCTWWRQEQVWTLEEAIRLLTSVPARLCGIADRGEIAPGLAADLFLFDPDALATGERSLQRDRVTGTPRFRSRPEGVRATIVGGVPTVEHGQPTGGCGGVVVRPTMAGADPRSERV